MQILGSFTFFTSKHGFLSLHINNVTALGRYLIADMNFSEHSFTKVKAFKYLSTKLLHSKGLPKPSNSSDQKQEVSYFNTFIRV